MFPAAILADMSLVDLARVAAGAGQQNHVHLRSQDGCGEHETGCRNLSLVELAAFGPVRW